MLIRKIRITIHRKRLMNAVLNYNNGRIDDYEYYNIRSKELTELLKLERRKDYAD